MILRRDFQYQTSFLQPAENPLSQGGRWLNGAAVGVDWCDIATTPGKAFGTQTGTKPPYDDSCAYCLPDSGRVWGANQDVRARVFLTSRAGWGGGFHEVELLMRGSIRANYNSTYEVIFSMNAGTTYCEIVRWNGPLGIVSGGGGAFTSLQINSGFSAPADGTWIRATMVGSVISGFTSPDGISWSASITPYDTAADAVRYISGLPGYGHWKNDAADVASTYGISEWSALAVT